MIPPITRSRNIRSFVLLNFTVLYVVCRFPLISDATSLMGHVGMSCWFQTCPKIMHCMAVKPLDLTAAAREGAMHTKFS